MRILLVAALAAAPVTAADAAPRRPRPVVHCRLVTDPIGDAEGGVNGVKNPNGDTGQDLVGADLATNAAKATAVFRLPKANQTDTMSPTGRRFTLEYTVGGKRGDIWVVVSETGNVAEGGGDIVLATEAGELRVTVPLAVADLAGVKPGTPVTGLRATTQRWAGLGTTGQTYGDVVDEASGRVAYPAGGRSCVVVGK